MRNNERASFSLAASAEASSSRIWASGSRESERKGQRGVRTAADERLQGTIARDHVNQGARGARVCVRACVRACLSLSLSCSILRSGCRYRCSFFIGCT